MSAIPTFPTFRPLQIHDRGAIEAMVSPFPPYSDFGFTSLWCWDRGGSCAVSRRKDTLIVQLIDYVSDVSFLTFLGQDDVWGTVHDLQEFALDMGLDGTLRLIPEAVFAADERLRHWEAVQPDSDNDDYLFAAQDWAHFAGAGFREHRRLVARCRERDALHVRTLDLADRNDQHAILDLFDRWAEHKWETSGERHGHERAALQRLFLVTPGSPVTALGFLDSEYLAGVMIWEELLDGDHVVCHFQKADRRFPGLSSWQAHETGKEVLALGCSRINFEQDLGIPGLRRAKQSLQPRQFLRKYTIDLSYPLPRP